LIESGANSDYVIREAKGLPRPIGARNCGNHGVLGSFSFFLRYTIELQLVILTKKE